MPGTGEGRVPSGPQGVRLEAVKVASGEGRAWDALSGRDPQEVAARACATYDGGAGLFKIRSFGQEFLVSPAERSVSSRSEQGAAILATPEYFFNLSVIWYLACARDVPLSGRLINPVHVKGGLIFAQGTHVLPLGALAERYGSDPEAFERHASCLGGSVVAGGDVAVQLWPFPRVPVVLALWLADEEFPPRADLMFDASCDRHLPTDVLWSVSSMTVLLMLDETV
ncbi:MAG: DUF3786 domain-containing protein [Chloroflexota bacterium]